MTTRHPALSPGTMIVRSADQASVDLGGEAAILNLKDGIYYGLDAVGARIWELIEEPQTVHDVCDTLCNEYDVDAERCKSDLITLLTELVQRGLIDIVNAP